MSPLPLSDGKTHLVEIDGPQPKADAPSNGLHRVPDVCVDERTGRAFQRIVTAIPEKAQDETKLPLRRNLLPDWMSEAKSA